MGGALQPVAPDATFSIAATAASVPPRASHLRTRWTSRLVRGEIVESPGRRNHPDSSRPLEGQARPSGRVARNGGFCFARQLLEISPRPSRIETAVRPQGGTSLPLAQTGLADVAPFVRFGPGAQAQEPRSCLRGAGRDRRASGERRNHGSGTLSRGSACRLTSEASGSTLEVAWRYGARCAR
jgi:hypothetical protein